MRVQVHKKSSLRPVNNDSYNNDDDLDISCVTVVRKSDCSHLNLNMHIIQYVFQLGLHTNKFRVPQTYSGA
jgi:hypothetical protein